MCLAVPARVAELLPGGMANVEIGGVLQKISLDLVENIKAGDYVIVHVGYAIQRLDEEEALRTLAIFDAILASASEKDEGNIL